VNRSTLTDSAVMQFSQRFRLAFHD